MKILLILVFFGQGTATKEVRLAMPSMQVCAQLQTAQVEAEQWMLEHPGWRWDGRYTCAKGKLEQSV
jgi:hypothetical protein